MKKLFLKLMFLLILPTTSFGNKVPTTLLDQYNKAGVCQAIKQELPNFHIKTCSLLPGGWDNLVAEINGEWIFRFPRHKDMAAVITREFKLLEQLNGLTAISIPHYEFIGQNIAMVGYRKLHGQKFLNQDYCALSNSAKQAIAESLALFIMQMHTALSVAEARELGYTEYNPPLDKIEQELLGTLPSAALEQLISKALASAREQKHAPSRLALIHNDLHGENMAYNATKQSIVGIFDFSDVAIANFAIEFSKLFLIDADLAERTVAARSQPTEAKNILKIAATDHIIRRATYLLEFREENNNSKEIEMIDMLTAFLPIWTKISNW